MPSCGAIEPGKSQEFTVTFTADHPSIEINNEVSEKVRLRARASSYMVYVQGWDELHPHEESLTEIIQEEEEGE